MHTMTNYRIIRQRDHSPRRKHKGYHYNKATNTWRVQVRRGQTKIHRTFPTQQQAAAAACALRANTPRTRRRPLETVWSNTGIRGCSDITLWIRDQSITGFRLSLGRGASRRHAVIYYGPKSRTRATALRRAKQLLGVRTSPSAAPSPATHAEK